MRIVHDRHHVQGRRVHQCQALTHGIDRNIVIFEIVHDRGQICRRRTVSEISGARRSPVINLMEDKNEPCAVGGGFVDPPLYLGKRGIRVHRFRKQCELIAVLAVETGVYRARRCVTGGARYIFDILVEPAVRISE